MVKIPCRLNPQVDHRFLTDGKDKITWQRKYLKFKSDLQIQPPGAQKIGNGILGFENGFYPGPAGFIPDLQKIEYLKANPTIPRHFEYTPGVLSLPWAAP